MTEFKKISDINITFAILVLIALTSAFVFPLTTSSTALNLGSDNEHTIGAMINYIAKSIANGIFPLRMETIMGGFPIYNNAQVNGLYPLYLFFDFESSSPLDLIRNLNRLTILHIVILAGNCYLMLRIMGASRAASLIGLIFMALSPQTIGLTKWANTIGSFTWIPLFLAGAILVMESRKMLTGTLMMAISMFLMASAQAGQAPIFAAFLLIFILFSRLFSNRRLRWRDSNVPLLGRLFIASAITLMLSAPTILPVLIAMPDSIRWIHEGTVIGLQPIPYDKFLIDQLAPVELFSIIFPLPNSHLITNVFIGVIPLALCSFLSLSKRQSYLVYALMFAGIYSLLSVFGEHYGFAYINYQIPLINKIREPSFFLVPLSISIACLASFGVEALRNTLSDSLPPKRVTRPLMITVFLVGVSAAICLANDLKLSKNVLLQIFIALAISSLPLAYSQLRIAFERKHWGNTLWLCLIAIVGSAMFYSSPRAVDTIKNSQYLLNKQIGLDKIFEYIKKIDSDAQFRVIFGGEIPKQAAAMRASYFGIRTLNSSIGPAPQVQFDQMYYHARRPGFYFAGLGARFMVCQNCSQEEITGFTLLTSYGAYQLFEAADSLPNYYMAERIIGVTSNLYDYEMMIKSTGLSPIPLVIDQLDRWYFEKVKNGTLLEKCDIRKLEENSNSMKFALSCKDQGFFVLNEFFSLDWIASLDGAAIKIMKVNGNQIGVSIPPGSHFLEIEFSPQIVRMSWLIFIMALAAFLVIWYIKSNEMKSLSKAIES